MFTKTAQYYDALYHFKDYKVACDKLVKLIKQYNPKAKSLLDVACGTGKHLEYLKEELTVAGLDLDTNLLEVAQKRCPEVPFYHGDMTNFKLDTTFDAVVCLFSSIAYVRTIENLNNTLKQMAEHVNPGGLLLVEPWIFPENYWVDRITANFVDQPDLKIAWMYKSQLEALTSVFDIHYLVASPEGVENFREKHIMGLWTDEQYRQAFRNIDIEPVYDATGFFGKGMYYGIKRS
ncbi:class I SAM-dependent DNA methyltransferase [Adhaeribacter pallidiroseus]|uniref:dTDP-3-amino-3,4, 6-trideoxy-alpha-D-glucopyranose n=1 Tax=Adhaeribacter pallidiroseus TaxID=2072847 RepID=A0A369QP47_9BACT|nr:class I SAM-dependent methyltransferase [Adhaeribacter pallidiroseus]RDC66112.1 dTDP-3-amino-3,4,6-trideoxy-alpha-D-glucopyranose [Adhaeribacter pallidiroseus]